MLNSSIEMIMSRQLVGTEAWRALQLLWVYTIE